MGMFSWFVRWKASTRRAFVVLCLLCGPVALLGTAWNFQVAATRTGPRELVTYAKLSSYLQAENAAHDYLLLALGGAEDAAGKLASRASLSPPGVVLNPQPLTVMNIRTDDLVIIDSGPDVEWRFLFTASVVPPDGSAAVPSMYWVTLVERNGSFQVVTWPEPTTRTHRAIAVGGWYTKKMDVNGPMGTQVSEFVTAFYTDPQVRRTADVVGQEVPKPKPLNRVVTENFQAKPIPNSLYGEVAVTDVSVGPSGGDPVHPNPGDTASVLVTFIGKLTSQTFLTQQVPLTMVYTKNKQWLVDGIDDAVHFGAVSAK